MILVDGYEGLIGTDIRFIRPIRLIRPIRPIKGIRNEYNGNK